MHLAKPVADRQTGLTRPARRIARGTCCRTTPPSSRRLPIGHRIAFASLCSLLFSSPVLAVGTAAGVPISNTASADYVIGGSASTAISNTVTLRVDEKLDVNVTWLDAVNIGVATPDTDRVTTFRVTNTGNGTDSYLLTVNNGSVSEQFDPVLTDIYIDSNGNDIFDAGIDTLYAPGVNDPVLAADAAQTVFVRNNIPTGLNGGDLGDTELVATSSTASGVPGTGVANAGENNTFAIIGSSGGTGNDTGTYEVAQATVALVKSVVVTDPSGGNQPVTGATLTYSITASVTGPGTATAVTITDAIPSNTSYTGGSLTLNAAALSDNADADAGDVDDTSANTVTVYLGDLTAVSPVQTISFAVTIN